MTRAGGSVNGALVPIQHAHRPRLRLFCAPYAGGSSVIFRRWVGHLPDDVDVYALEAPGHGTRLREEPVRRLAALIALLVEPVRQLSDRPFVFFGHSMGGLVAFELARELRRSGARLPDRLVVSGAAAPHVARAGRRPIHTLSDAEFLAWLAVTNGTPRAVLASAELMRLMLPVIRADFEACETYRYTAEPPLDCAISAFGGEEDQEVPRVKLDSWRDLTAGQFSIRSFAGGHFFIQSSAPVMLRALRDELDGIVGTGWA